MQRLSENGRYYAQRVELSKAEEKKDAQHVHRYYQNEATAFYNKWLKD